ncbi:hypothetical protein K437DRAFT_256086 [Tilletiaria anomala UBC 951]|uniref:CAP-Gly domain-containing protein n=1 Tax=Tilletiaria anomala (strain ATCC 24038 / CBS 436.72 / UBC 951) TaxID=1037660 RepID=A0A066VZA8_TILAU|nr:uncharacterized protein K437DRAFT_256086 [Tilletiaria anomala UBC 951]KDN46811.1 hypothetical protein K437DRAFT_256086 [Tilletiaria anomala UBC 951]
MSMLQDPLADGGSTSSFSPITPRAFSVGQRISHHHSRGTVRFVGALGASSNGGRVPSGTWLGVEWDDRRRGKHWGEYGGWSYFECLYHCQTCDSEGKDASGDRQKERASKITSSPAAAATSTAHTFGPASFLRPTASGLITGASVLQALRDKYAPNPKERSTTLSPSERQNAQYSRKNLAEIEIEIPYLDKVVRKVGRLDRLRNVALQGKIEHFPEAEGGAQSGSFPVEAPGNDETEEEERLLVSCAFDQLTGENEGDIQKACPNITVLDLSNNLLSTWQDVSAIWAELPLLESFILAGNRLTRLPTLPTAPALTLAPKLKELNLDCTLVDWPDVVRVVTSSMPALEELSFAGNKARRLSLDSCSATRNTSAGSVISPHTKLRTINLAGNELSDWAGDIVTFIATVFPRLVRLNLSHNRLAAIVPPPQHLQQQISKLPEADTNTPGDQRTPPLPASLLAHVNISNNPGLHTWADLEALDEWVRVANTDGKLEDQEGEYLQGATRGAPSGIKTLVLDLGSEVTRLSLDSDAQPHGTSASSAVSKEADEDELHPITTAQSWRTLHPGDATIALIARLPALSTLNGGMIRPEQRRDAEVYVLSKYVEASTVSTWAAASTNAAVPLPRFADLAAKYRDSNATMSASAAPDRAAGVQRPAKATLKSKLLDLHIIFLSQPPSSAGHVAGSAGGDGAREAALRIVHDSSLKLLLSTPLRMVRAKLARLAPPPPLAVSEAGVHRRSVVAGSSLQMWALLGSGVEDQPEGSADGSRKREKDNDENEQREAAERALVKGLGELPLMPLDDDHQPLDHFGVSQHDCILVYHTPHP